MSTPETGCPRIFCIGRNYAKHIAELGDAKASQCVIFMKPFSCIVPEGEPITLPRDRGAVHYETEIVIRIDKGGEKIEAAQAGEHIGALTLGLDLTLRDLQNELKAQGAPWERSKAFDQSAPLGAWTAYDSKLDLRELEFSCHLNAEPRQQGHTGDMLFPIAELVSVVSQNWRLQPGDLIFTGTPEGVGALTAGDHITLASDALGTFSWSTV